MAFDGVPYYSSRRIAPYEYHPRAPITGGALATALRGSYAYSRNRARLISVQSYPRLIVDHGRLATDVGGTYSVARLGNSWTTCWRVERTVPQHHTHLVIRVLLQVLSFAECTISARATHKTTNGSSVSVPLGGAIPVGHDPNVLGGGNTVDAAWNRQYGMGSVPPGTDTYVPPNSFFLDESVIGEPVMVECDVAMVDQGARYFCELQMQSNKTGDDRPSIRMASLVAWSEVRDG